MMAARSSGTTGVADDPFARSIWDFAPGEPSDSTLHPIENGRSLDGDEPIPLFPPLPASAPYPADSLGPVLAPAAVAIARKVQVPVAVAAQSVLATAALAAQAHADVRLPFGQTRPISLFLVTVAASGDRKSTSDNEASWPIKKHERSLKDRYEAELASHKIDSAAWSAERRKIETDKNIDLSERKRELFNLGPEPKQPLFPFLTAPEPTVEGLTKAWVNAPASQGIFTAEGGMFIGGSGMSQENRLRTAATYSEMWDGKPIKRIRAQDGVTILDGRRLSMHLMVQHEAAAQFLADGVLRDQGLLSRVLVAAPETVAGTRLWRVPDVSDDAAIRTYGARILQLLEADWPLTDRNELEPRVLPFSAEAATLWCEFHDHIERQCGPGGDLRPIQDFAGKAAEHAARVAGVLSVVDDPQVQEISGGCMRNAIQLVDWYVDEAVRLSQTSRTDPKLFRANQLLEWLRTRPERETPFRDILRIGPAPMRTKRAADEALGILAEHGWTSDVSKRPRVVRLANWEGAR